jgi:DNA (cytosine-5)-methyltransferase 1
MAVYYNDNDRFASQWLRNLVAAGHLPAGDVDERSILDIDPADLAGYTQCHFFAGIGGWPYALRLADWPDDREVWTGSCPCQPLSSAGQRRGHADERHLWPAFHALIAECRPATVFGEQVASRDGREWLCGIRADLERLGYACGAADLCAASAGAPHIRQRLFWVVDARYGAGSRGFSGACGAAEGGEQENNNTPGGRGETGRLGDAGSKGRGSQRGEPEISEFAAANPCAGGLGDAGQPGLEGRRRHPAEQGRLPEHVSGSDGGDFWANAAWLPCLDGKARRVEPSIQPLAERISGDVGILRASGNAIVPQVAATFVRAVMES